MGEAKRKKAMRARMEREAGERSWATGSITIAANNVECFDWSGTRREAIDLQKRFLDAVNMASPFSAASYADRAVAYVGAFGMPKAGEQDYRPSGLGARWQQNAAEVYKAAILWSVLHEHLPNPEKKVEDIFVGKVLGVHFTGDKAAILEETKRELHGQPFSGTGHVTMEVRVLNESYRLDPRAAVCTTWGEMYALAGKPLPESLANETVYVPRIPVDAVEADAMMQMLTILADATDPSWPIQDYAGYTDLELSGGKTCVKIR